MSETTQLGDDLVALNHIIETLNRTVDMRGILDRALEQLLEVMGLETGWIFLRDPSAQERWHGKGYVLAAYRNLPPALALDRAEAWDKGCDCQGYCDAGKLEQAYNEVRCSRLEEAGSDRRGLIIHASAPLRSGENILGILNVAAVDWVEFTSRALELLSNVGNQMGAALERARLYDVLREQRILEQEILLSLSNQLLARLDMQEIMDFLIQEIPAIARAEACAILLRDPAKGLQFFVNEGQTAVRMAPADVVKDQSLSQSVQVYFDLDKSGLPAQVRDWFRMNRFHSLVQVSMYGSDALLGDLLLATREDWQLDPEETRFLRLVANQAAIAIEKSRLHATELIQQNLDAELAMARRIQASMLPGGLPEIMGWELAAAYSPARQVGGDFYDIFEIQGETGRWGLVIADVVDKGVPAALFMTLCRTMIRSAALPGRSPAQALENAHDLILRDSTSSLFVSVAYAVLDTQNGEVTFANAGHNPLLWMKADSEVILELNVPGMVLGVIEQVELSESTIRMSPGDSLVLYTDGITEAFNSSGDVFGLVRLQKVLEAHRDGNSQNLLDAVLQSVHDFIGETDQSDDLTLLVLKRE